MSAASDLVQGTAAERMRAIFQADKCQCGEYKSPLNPELLCWRCMDKLSPNVRYVLFDVELAGALEHFYNAALINLAIPHHLQLRRSMNKSKHTPGPWRVDGQFDTRSASE